MCVQVSHKLLYATDDFHDHDSNVIPLWEKFTEIIVAEIVANKDEVIVFDGLAGPY